MRQYIRSSIAMLLGLSLLLCTGCSSLFPYESAEEQKQQEANQNNLGLNGSGDVSQEAIDLAAIQSDDLVYTNTLRNSAGSVLATYSGSVPTFLAPSGHAAAFQRINEHFQVQYQAFREDCEAYFNRVKQYYGDQWDTVTLTTTVFNTTVTYSLLQAPKHYLSLEFDYTSCLDGTSQTTYRLGEVLLLDTGWVLQAAELFGSHYEAAQSRILADVTQWAVDKGILSQGVAVSFTAEKLLKNFALTETQLVLYLDAYTLSSSNASSHVVRLDLENYADLITDIEIPEGSGDSDDTDQPLTPDHSLLPDLPGTVPGDGDTSGDTSGDTTTGDDTTTDGDTTTDDNATGDGTGTDADTNTDTNTDTDTNTGTQE